MLPCTGTMQSSRLLSGALLCALLLLSSAAGAEVLDSESEEELSPRALRDFYPKGPNLTSEKQLVRSAPGVRMQTHGASLTADSFLLLSRPFLFFPVSPFFFFLKKITFSYAVKNKIKTILFIVYEATRVKSNNVTLG